ncbi:MAG: LexA family transcriptional regulator [Sphingomonas sp.]|uniref:S24 family peptidase n=1 Tax=Sphingomonas sp. TaxID=28214 RepID=UPI001B2D279F|nr:LexA family transcriptional regulator [Sphingomonas sp.]MBO9624031.1 LexA family transcriptional regulator [Sphingomonas sp.]
MDGDEQRAALEALMAEQGASLSELSRVIGRNPAYLQQYLKRGTPRLLAEADRALLARYFGVPDARLGGPAPEGLVEVARLDLGASAGPGRIAEEEARRAPALLSPALLRALGVRAGAASIIRVEGDSMEPTLSDGDEILVDGDRRDVKGKGGIFVIRLDGTLMVKRLRPAVGGVEVVSDNSVYPTRLCGRGEVEVIGRVVWFSRALV